MCSFVCYEGVWVGCLGSVFEGVWECFACVWGFSVFFVISVSSFPFFRVRALSEYWCNGGAREVMLKRESG